MHVRTQLLKHARAPRVSNLASCRSIADSATDGGCRICHDRWWPSGATCTCTLGKSTRTFLSHSITAYTDFRLSPIGVGICCRDCSGPPTGRPFGGDACYSRLGAMHATGFGALIKPCVGRPTGSPSVRHVAVMLVCKCGFPNARGVSPAAGSFSAARR